MSCELSELLGSVDVMEPVSVDGLQVFGLRPQSDSALPYITLDEALQAENLVITETNEGGRVPEVRVVNKGDVMVFLMAGEHLIGAKQNRVVNASMMVAAHGDLTIPVSCVEQGRWGYRSRTFSGSPSSSHRALRHMLVRQTMAAYRRSGTPSSHQGEVWREVHRKLGAVGSSSRTAELEQVYRDHSAGLREVIDRVDIPEGCAGVAIAIGGRLAGMDMFDKSSTLRKLLPKLLSSYAIDALEESGGMKLDRETVRSWLQSAAAAKVEPFDSPGLGKDVRISGEGVVGAFLVLQDQVVHAELFTN